jgi:hypothetical protein
VTRLRNDPANTPRCADEAIGMVVRIDPKTLTLKSPEGEITLALANALDDIRAGDTVRARYRKSDGKLNARLISRVTPESTQANSEGWRIGAGTPTPRMPECGSRESFAALIPAAGAFVVTFVFSFLFGWSWPFLNRSTHQPLYTSRLVRAYLGASNPRRLGATGKSVTQPIRGDDVNQEDYWPRHAWLRPRSEPPADDRVEDTQLLAKIRDDEDRLLAKGMPLHLVNVTINETLDARTQVEQRDRKGIGMAVGPAAISVGVFHHLVVANAREETTPASGEARALEAEVYPGEGAYRIFRYDPSPLPGRLNYTGEFLTLGGWTGISGAAFSTSLGWRSSLAFSLLAGLGNVRLTYWWNSGVKPLDRFSRRAAMTRRRMRHRMMRLFHRASSVPAIDQDSFPESRTSWALRWLSGALRGLFSVQTFLFDEFLARFHGTAPQWWPLSDGGHFENLGGYELIRRRLPVIVIIDAEADPDYTFEGLSNLVRKARLDFGAEITFLTDEELDERLHPAVRRHFGTIEQLRRGVWVEEPVGDPNDPKAGQPPDTGTGERKLRRRRTINPVTDEALSLAHAALAEVRYDGDAGPPSTLLYIKPTLIGDEPTDVHRYHTDHPSFPHETTFQQFFDEAQWESYRKLGEQIALKVFQEPPSDLQGGRGSLFPHRLLSSPPA